MYCLVPQYNVEGILEERPANTEGPGSVRSCRPHTSPTVCSCDGPGLCCSKASLRLQNAQGEET